MTSCPEDRGRRHSAAFGAAGTTATVLTLLLVTPASLPAQGESALFSLDLGLVIWTWVLFLLTLGILAWKVFPWIAGGLEERRAKIQGMIDEARRDREEAREALERHEKRLAEARQESRRILEEGREAGERLRKEILEEARAEQEKMLVRARREMERERDRLADEVRREAIEVSIAAAERLLRAHMDTEENRELVRETMAELT